MSLSQVHQIVFNFTVNFKSEDSIPILDQQILFEEDEIFKSSGLCLCNWKSVTGRQFHIYYIEDEKIKSCDHLIEKVW